MVDRQIHGNRSVFSASAALECIARALSEIKTQDRLTYADIGAVLGKSEDQAAKYCDGSATMDAVTFARGKREWNGRFTGYATDVGAFDGEFTPVTFTPNSTKFDALLADADADGLVELVFDILWTPTGGIQRRFLAGNHFISGKVTPGA